MTYKAAKALITKFHTAGVIFYTRTTTGEKMVTINDAFPGTVPYTLTVVEAAERVKAYTRTLARL